MAKRHYQRPGTDGTLCGWPVGTMWMARQEMHVTCRQCLRSLTEPWHGTLGGYSNHKCRCVPCTTANTVYQQDWRDRHWGMEPPIHGRSGYMNYGCRCDVCGEDKRLQRLEAAS